MNNLVLDTWQLKSTDYYIEHDSIMKLAIIRKILATDTLLLARELRDVICEMKICVMFHLNQSHAICKIWTISCRSRGVELSNSVPKYVIYPTNDDQYSNNNGSIQFAKDGWQLVHGRQPIDV